MDPARPRILDEFPTPIAYSYALIFDPARNPSVRRWALCFTEYQALRLIALPLVGQYLRSDLSGIDLERDKPAKRAVETLNTAIAGIRAPFFSDWITLVETLRSRLPALGLTPLYPGLDAALKTLSRLEPREFNLPNEPELNPVRAILALRNQTAHGGVPDETAAERHLETYLPVLHQVLGAFDFLGDCRLLVHEPTGPSVESGAALVRSLRGAHPGPPAVVDLSDILVDAFAESPAVLLGPDGRAEPLYPLFNPQPQHRPNDDHEAIYLYDGHHGIRVETRGEAVEKGDIHYLGVHHRLLDTPACAHLKELLARRQVAFYLPKEKVAPWTIAETAADYSRHITLAEMLGTKYLPECYVPFPDLERHFDAFLNAKPPRAGLVLTGLAGSGKSAFLAHRVERLMRSRTEGIPQDHDVRENPNLVFFLRGNGIAPRASGVSLFRDIAEKLGIATAAGKGIATFGELLDHLGQKWKSDRVEGRRLILVIDGLNEAPEPRAVLAEALTMIEAAARFPWCKIAVSTRLEWLTVWSGKQTAQEASPLEKARRCLYHDETRGQPGQPAEPVVGVEPFTLDQAEAVYARYQAGSGHQGGPRVPACPTPWPALAPATRDLLLNPLYLHLFMETFDGRPADSVTTVPDLFRRYVDQAVREHPGLAGSIAAVTGHLLAELARPTADLGDDDVNAIRLAWAGSLTVEERQQRMHPVEDLAHEGWMRKRVREEGGGYRFTFQAVAEYLVYLDLARSRDSSGEDELTYWTRRAAAAMVFPEYAGAFAYLFRDWARRGTLGLAARIVESSPRWFDDALVGFLVEQTRLEHTPGRASPHVRAAARALAAEGGRWTVETLHRAGYELMATRFAPEATIFYQESLPVREALWAANPDNVGIGNSLGSALNNLGNLLSDAGRVVDAERAYRRSVEISEALWAANPDNVGIGAGLGMALNNLGNLLSDVGRVGDAERAYRRSVEISEALWAANPDNVEIGAGLGGALNNLGLLLSDAGRVGDAERAYRRSVEIREALWAANPDNVGIGDSLGGALNNLGILLRDAGRVGDAERAYRRSVEISEALWAANPDNVDIGDSLGRALNNLGLLLSDAGRVGDAERAYRRSVEISEALWAANPDNVGIGAGLGSALNNLGNLLSDAGRVDDAERAYRRSVEFSEALWAANPDNVGIGDSLGRALNNLGLLLRDAGRVGDAERAYRRSVEISEALWAANPDNVGIGDGLGRALNNLGLLLSAAGRVGDAERAYRRSVEIFEALWAANPDNVGIKAGYAGSLCSVGRWDEAAERIGEVLALVPAHAYANKLLEYIQSRRVT